MAAGMAAASSTVDPLVATASKAARRPLSQPVRKRQASESGDDDDDDKGIAPKKASSASALEVWLALYGDERWQRDFVAFNEAADQREKARAAATKQSRLDHKTPAETLLAEQMAAARVVVPPRPTWICKGDAKLPPRFDPAVWQFTTEDPVEAIRFLLTCPQPTDWCKDWRVHDTIPWTTVTAHFRQLMHTRLVPLSATTTSSTTPVAALLGPGGSSSSRTAHLLTTADSHPSPRSLSPPPALAEQAGDAEDAAVAMSTSDDAAPTPLSSGAAAGASGDSTPSLSSSGTGAPTYPDTLRFRCDHCAMRYVVFTCRLQKKKKATLKLENLKLALRQVVSEMEAKRLLDRQEASDKVVSTALAVLSSHPSTTDRWVLHPAWTQRVHCRDERDWPIEKSIQTMYEDHGWVVVEPPFGSTPAATGIGLLPPILKEKMPSTIVRQQPLVIGDVRDAAGDRTVVEAISHQEQKYHGRMRPIVDLEEYDDIIKAHVNEDDKRHLEYLKDIDLWSVDEIMRRKAAAEQRRKEEREKKEEKAEKQRASAKKAKKPRVADDDPPPSPTSAASGSVLFPWPGIGEGVTSGSFCDLDSLVWNEHISLLVVMPLLLARLFKGGCTTYAYIKSLMTMFGSHVEQLYAATVSLMCYGTETWAFYPEPDVEKVVPVFDAYIGEHRRMSPYLSKPAAVSKAVQSLFHLFLWTKRTFMTGAFMRSKGFKPHILVREANTLLMMDGRFVHCGWSSSRVTVSRSVNLFTADWLLQSLEPLLAWYARMQSSCITYAELRGWPDVRSEDYMWPKLYRCASKSDKKRNVDKENNQVELEGDRRKSTLEETIWWPAVERWRREHPDYKVDPSKIEADIEIQFTMKMFKQALWWAPGRWFFSFLVCLLCDIEWYEVSVGSGAITEISQFGQELNGGTGATGVVNWRSYRTKDAAKKVKFKGWHQVGAKLHTVRSNLRRLLRACWELAPWSVAWGEEWPDSWSAADLREDHEAPWLLFPDFFTL